MHSKQEEESIDFLRSNNDQASQSRVRATSIKFNSKEEKIRKRQSVNKKNLITSQKQLKLFQNSPSDQQSYEEGLDESIHIDANVLAIDVSYLTKHQITKMQNKNSKMLQEKRIYTSMQRIINEKSNKTIPGFSSPIENVKRDNVEEFIKELDISQIIDEYNNQYARNPHDDNYNIALVSSDGWKGILNNYDNYLDDFPQLYLRKIIVLIFEIIALFCEKIIRSQQYRYIMLLLISAHIALVITKYYSDFSILYLEFYENSSKIFFTIYLIEISIRIFGSNLIHFLCSFWNLFDLLNLVLLALLVDEIITFDFTPLRAVRVLIFLSHMSSQLRLTFRALIKSFRYMIEALLIVLIFSVFFANVGFHQFKDLTQNKCVDLQLGIVIINSYCGWLDCPSETLCISIPIDLEQDSISNFNNFQHSFVSIVRIITMDNWTDLMYTLLYSLNPFVWVYFVFVIFIVGFFAFNLIIAIQKTYYSKLVSTIEYHNAEEESKNNQLNLQFIKCIGLYDKLIALKQQNVKLEQENNSLYNNVSYGRQQFLQSPQNATIHTPNQSFYQSIKKMQSFYEKQQSDRSKKKYQPWHFLSARQKREMEQNKNKIQNLLTSHKISWRIRNLLLPKRELSLDKGILKYFDSEEEQEILKYFHQQDIYSWRTQVLQNNYASDSECDILRGIYQGMNVQKKLQAELRKIQSFKLKQFYTYFSCGENQEIKHLESISKLQRKFPIRISQRTIITESSTFDDLRNDQILLVKSPRRQISSLQSRGQKRSKTQLIKQEIADCFFEFPEYQEGQSYFLMNGIKWNYESLQILINREIISNDENETQTHQIFFHKYLKFRSKEIKLGYIAHCNISVQDVTKQLEFSKLLSILRALNTIKKFIWITGFRGSLQALVNIIDKLVNNKHVNFIFDFSALINFSVLCSIGYIEDNLIDLINFWMTIVLAFQVLLKLIGKGVVQFCRKQSNLLDVFIILVALLHDFIEDVNTEIQLNYSSEIKAMRAVGALFLYRVVKYNQFIIRIMDIASITIKKYLSLAFLMLSSILFFAIIGMQLCIQDFEETDNLSQLHSFKSFAKSWMTIFNITTNDDAIGMLKVILRYQQPWIGITFYISVVFSINYLINGLVLAVLLDAFSAELETQAESNNDQSLDLLRRLGIEEELKLEANNIQITKTVENIGEEVVTDTSNFLTPRKQTKINLKDLPETSRKLFMKQKTHFAYFSDTQCRDSCYLFSYKNKFRKLCYKLSKSLVFRFLDNLTILLTTIFLIRISFDNQNLDIYHIHFESAYFELFLGQNIILLINYIVSIISYGFILDEGSTFRDLLKFFDLIYLTAYYVRYVNDSPILNVLLYLGIIRVILVFGRPIMLINIFESVQGVKKAMIQSLLQIINIIAVILLVFMVFNVFAMHLYHNKLGYCDNFMNFGVNQKLCELQNLQWINHPYNFDNFKNGLFTLIVVSSFDAWGEVMQICSNANFANIGPTPFQNQWTTYVLFVIFIFVGAMFFMGFLTGVLFIEFKKFTKKLENKNLNQEQSQFIQICSVILIQKPNYSRPPDSLLRQGAYNLMVNKNYKIFYNLLLVSNSLILCFLFDITTAQFRNLANSIYQFFAILFLLDCLIKILALGGTRYLAQTWRVLELVLTLTSVLDFIFDLQYRWFKKYTAHDYSITIVYMARIFMVIRDLKILLIFQEFKGLQRLLRVLYFSSPLLLKIIYVQIIIQTTYAFIGCELFKNITMGQVIDQNYLNFKNFLNSALILFKCTTGDDWRAVIIDCSKSNRFCTQTQCGSDWAYLYFLSYYLLSNIIIMNLFVLALVDQFENFFNNTTNVIQTYVENIDHFCNCWCRYTSDTEGSKLHTRFIARFLLDLSEPLGARQGDNIWDTAYDAFNFRIKAQFKQLCRDSQGFVNFNDLLYETIRFAFVKQIFKEGSVVGKAEMKLFDIAMKQKLSQQACKKQIENFKIKIVGQINDSVDFKYQNFNILQEYLQLLIVFKTWKTFSKRLFERSQRGILEYTEQTSQEAIESYASPSPLKMQEKTQIEEKLHASQAIEENQMELIKTFQESNKLKHTNSNNSSTFQGVIFEPAGNKHSWDSKPHSLTVDNFQRRRVQAFTFSDLMTQQFKNN